MTQENIRKKYLDSVNTYKILETREDKLIIILSVLRLFTFIGGLVIIWIGFSADTTAGIILSLIFIIFFLLLLKLYAAHSAKKEFYACLVKINQNEANAISGDFSVFESGTSYIDIKHDFSFDVDLFGPASLFQYLNRTVTSYGRDILATWLSDPFSVSTDAESRQVAISEIASKDKWRHEFMAYGMKTTLSGQEISGLLSWLEVPDVINSSFLKKTVLYLLPLAALISLLLTISGVIYYPVFITIFLVNLLYVASGLRNINSIHNSLTTRYNFLSSINSLLITFSEETFSSSVLNDIKIGISGEQKSAALSVRKLGKLIQAFDSRTNMLAGALLNGLLLWDYQCISRLEKWKSENRLLFPVWLKMIGQIDAYNSLGNYAYNNPGFAYPYISGSNEMFTAKNLGHQLIDERRRVCNDFSLGKNGTICIISGANMAGKSTFLRTVAINYILGMTGAPVCATEMSFMPAKLFTSMRTMDSLSENESYFYAELRRLNLLKLKVEAGEPVFFILDEILKGTNSEDKSTGSKLFLRKLIERQGTGLLATHDTSLGKMEADYKGIIINKCFEIEIDGENIRFDYKIQEGITQKMNAVFLMRQMGILDKEKNQ